MAAKFIWNTWKKEREEYVDIIKKGQEDIKKNQADILNTNEHLIQLEQKRDDRNRSILFFNGSTRILSKLAPVFPGKVRGRYHNGLYNK